MNTDQLALGFLWLSIIVLCAVCIWATVAGRA